MWIPCMTPNERYFIGMNCKCCTCIVNRGHPRCLIIIVVQGRVQTDLFQKKHILIFFQRNLSFIYLEFDSKQFLGAQVLPFWTSQSAFLVKLSVSRFQFRKNIERRGYELFLFINLLIILLHFLFSYLSNVCDLHIQFSEQPKTCYYLKI